MSDVRLKFKNAEKLMFTVETDQFLLDKYGSVMYS